MRRTRYHHSPPTVPLPHDLGEGKYRSYQRGHVLVLQCISREILMLLLHVAGLCEMNIDVELPDTYKS